MFFFFVCLLSYILVYVNTVEKEVRQIFLSRWQPLTLRRKDSSLKKTKRCVSAEQTHLFIQLKRQSSVLRLFPSAAEEDAGSAGEDSGADAVQPDRLMLIL